MTNLIRPSLSGSLRRTGDPNARDDDPSDRERSVRGRGAAACSTEVTCQSREMARGRNGQKVEPTEEGDLSSAGRLSGGLTQTVGRAPDAGSGIVLLSR